MRKHSRNSDREEILRFENELKKMKLSAEYGAIFGRTDASIPPEIERLWLERVMEFEKAYARRKLISVYEKIGMPNFKNVNSIPDGDISYELSRIRQIMRLNRVEVDSIKKIDDREMYRFITEVIFPFVTENIPINGFVQHFTYEEFMDSDI